MIERSFIQRILPHQSPFLFIDMVSQYNGLPKPSLRAEITTSYSVDKFLLDKEDSFWPVGYLIEGLGQCILLLSVFYKVESAFGIKNNQEISHIQQIVDLITSADKFPKQYQNNGLLAHIDLKQYKEVKVGKKVQYKIDLNLNQGKLFRYRVDAKVDNETVIDGFMIGSQI